MARDSSNNSLQMPFSLQLAYNGNIPIVEDHQQTEYNDQSEFFRKQQQLYNNSKIYNQTPVILEENMNSSIENQAEEHMQQQQLNHQAQQQQQQQQLNHQACGDLNSEYTAFGCKSNNSKLFIYF
jgi:hypothetical protein